MKKKQSQVWNYFKNKKTHAVCSIELCGAQKKTEGGSTSGLRSHLRAIHGINLNENNYKLEHIIENGSYNITKFTNNKNNLDQIIAKLAALDIISINVITNSETISFLAKQSGYKNFPESNHTTKKIIMNYCAKIKNKIKNVLENEKKKFLKFTLAIDEWTSLQNKRFINIILYSNSFFINLGMKKIEGKADAQKLLEVCILKLQEFGLNFDDILCITTDGDKKMQKFVELTGKLQHTCYSHALHLAVNYFIKDLSAEQIENENGQNHEHKILEKMEDDNSDSDISSDGNLDIKTLIIKKNQ